MAHKRPANPERSFGLSVGGVLCAIALFLLWRGRVGRAEILGGIGVALLLLGLLQPKLLKPLSDVWWRFSAVLGRFNARLLLSIFFLLVLTPIGIVWRVIGRDPLARRRTNWHGWSLYPARYKDRQHFNRMF